MNKRLLGGIATLLLGAGSSVGQTPAPPPAALPPLLHAGPVPDALPVLPASATAGPQTIVPAGPAVVSEGIPMPTPVTKEPLVVPLDGSFDPFACGPDGIDGASGGPGGNRFSLFGCAWASADFLAYWVKSAPSPIPLVTTAPVGGTGFLGAPGTSTVFGGSGFDYPPLYGGRFSVGICEPQYICGFEFTGFFLSTRSTQFGIASSPVGAPLLARPIFDPVLGREDAQLISFPGAFAGNFATTTSIDLWGFETNLVKHKWTHKWQGDHKLAGACLDTDVLAGFRFINLNESLNMFQNTTVLPGGVAGFAGSVVMAPATLSIADQFLTTNNFYGGQLGFQSVLQKGCCFASVQGKAAIGDTYQVANIAGNTTLSRPTGTVATVPGGLFGLSSNNGLHSRHAFSVVPEVGMNIGVELWKHVRIYGGYNFLYWSDVVRPGDQVDRAVNKNQLPSSLSFGTGGGPVRPVATLQTSDFWAHGLNAGVAIRY